MQTVARLNVINCNSSVAKCSRARPFEFCPSPAQHSCGLPCQGPTWPRCGLGSRYTVPVETRTRSDIVPTWYSGHRSLTCPWGRTGLFWRTPLICSQLTTRQENQCINSSELFSDDGIGKANHSRREAVDCFFAFFFFGKWSISGTVKFFCPPQNIRHQPQTSVLHVTSTLF